MNKKTDHRRQEVQQIVKNACDQLNAEGVDARNYVEQLAWLFFLKAFDEAETRKIEEGAFDAAEREPNFGFASYLIRVRVDQAKVLPRYLAYFLNSTNGRSELDSRRRTSAGQFNINSDNLRSIPLPVRPIAVQQRLPAQLEQREMQDKLLVSELVSVNTESTGLREAILRKAFAGGL